jgi:hypothetical protein
LQTNPHKPPLWRTLLVLGRISNLPTVWSNCLAGWLLGGGGEWSRFGVLCAGGSLLYTGGMFLNDACDSRFDAQHRSERPIPSGAIQVQTVWLLGTTCLSIGLLLLAVLGKTPALFALGLVACIIIYDVVHKKTVLSPVIMSACRFLLYLLATSCAVREFSILSLWYGFILAFYIMGLSYLARREATNGRINLWALFLLFAPIVMAYFLKQFLYASGLIIMLAFVAWVIWCVRRILNQEPGAIGRAVSGLLAGIVLVDLLAVQNVSGTFLLVFPLLFGGALILQRVVPAT